MTRPLEHRVYTADGFYDAVNPVSGKVAQRFTAVSQGCVFLGLANTLSGRSFGEYWAHDTLGAAVKPYSQLEDFGVTATR